MLLDIVDFLQRLLVGRHPPDDADAGNDRLILLQPVAQIEHCATDDYHQQAQPEGEAPLTPEEWVILHRFGRIELVGMNRIHRHREHLQCQRVAMEVLAVYLHIERRDGIYVLIEGGNRIVACHHHLVVAHLRGISLQLHHLDARNNLVLRLEVWHHHLGTLRGGSLEVQDGLLSDEHLQGVDALLHGLTESQCRAAHQRHRQYDILNFHSSFFLNLSSLLKQCQERFGEILVSRYRSPIYLTLGKELAQLVLASQPVLGMRDSQLLRTGIDIHLMPRFGIHHLEQSHIWQLLSARVIHLDAHHIMLLVGNLQGMLVILLVVEVADEEGGAVALHHTG